MNEAANTMTTTMPSLNKHSKRILDVVIAAAPNAVSTPEIVERSGLTTQCVRTHTCILVDNSMITRIIPGVFRASNVESSDASQELSTRNPKTAEMGRRIIASLKLAGRAGRVSSEIQEITGILTRDISSWWTRLGRHQGEVTKVGRGHYVLTEFLMRGDEMGMPRIPTKLVAEVAKVKAQERAHLGEEHGGKVFWTQEELEHIAKAVASLWWDTGLRFDYLHAIKHVMDTPELRGEVRYRNVQSASAIKGLAQLISKKINEIKEMYEENAGPAPVEVKEVVKEVKQSPKEAIMELSIADRIKLFMEVLTEGVGPVLSLLEGLTAGARPVMSSPVNRNPYVPEPIKEVEKVRLPSVCLIAMADNQQVDKLRAAVSDVFTIDQPNIRQGGAYNFSDNLIAVFGDVNKPGLTELKNRGRKQMLATGRTYIEEYGYRLLERSILMFADKLRAQKKN